MTNDPGGAGQPRETTPAPAQPAGTMSVPGVATIKVIPE